MLRKVKNVFSSLKEELLSYTYTEQAFIFFAMLCGFFICCEYSIIRPISHSLFIQTFSAHAFPYAWLALMPINFFIVSLYNRFLPRWGSKKLFLSLIFMVITINIFFALFCKKIPSLSFFFYIWKEIYVLMLFQLLWSVIHSNIELKKAKYLYGIFFGVGGLGSILGSSIPSFFAISYGSENLLFFSIPVCILLSFTYIKMSHYSTGKILSHKPEEKGGMIHGIRLIMGSRFLIFILLVVCFMQISSAIVDFQFNNFLGRSFPIKDVRTEYAARIMGIVHTMTVILQFMGSYFLIKWMGMKRSHYSVPTFLGIPILLMIAMPVFPVISFVFVVYKTMDFSIFGVIKEMLYVPLKPDEKYRAKAVIDVFAYRGAKTFASLLILFVQFAFVHVFHILSFVNVLIVILWIFSVSYGLKEYEKMISSSTL